MKSNGYNGTSVKDIVDAAGVPKGSFYNYFDSKESFAVEALEAVATEQINSSHNLISVMSSDASPMQRLHQFFSQNAAMACDAEFKVGCFFGNMCQEMSDNNEAIRKKVRHGLDYQTEIIQVVLDQAKEAGEISCDCKTETIAEFILNAWEGALMRMKATKSRQPLDAFLDMLPHIIK